LVDLWDKINTVLADQLNLARIIQMIKAKMELGSIPKKNAILFQGGIFAERAGFEPSIWHSF